MPPAHVASSHPVVDQDASLIHPAADLKTPDQKTQHIAPQSPAPNPSIQILHELLDKCIQPASGPTSPEILKKVEDLLISASSPQKSQSEQRLNRNEENNDQRETSAPETEKQSKTLTKQTDIRSHLQGAGSNPAQNTSHAESRNSKKKKLKKDKKKRKISTSPRDQKEKKKGRQSSPNVTEHVSPYASMSEYESMKSVSSDETPYEDPP